MHTDNIRNFHLFYMNILQRLYDILTPKKVFMYQESYSSPKFKNYKWHYVYFRFLQTYSENQKTVE